MRSKPTSPSPRRRPRDTAAALPLTGLSIVAVDDEPDAGGFLQAEMERLGAQVTVATSCVEALGLLAKRNDDEPVVIADVGMPGEDGYVFIQKLRALDGERGRQTPAIALTAYARPEDRARALSAGYHQHIAKPVDIELLVRAVLETADTVRKSRQNDRPVAKE